MKNVLDSARIIIYRCHEKGLEVLLIDRKLQKDPSVWRYHEGRLVFEDSEAILLSDFVMENGHSVSTIAIDADVDKVPSVRGIIKHDIKRLKNKIETIGRNLIDEYTYINVHTAIQSAMPQERQLLKELSDIITDRNLTRYI